MEITKSVDIAEFVANPATAVQAAQWEAITEAQQDAELAQLARARLIDLKQPVRITLAEL